MLRVVFVVCKFISLGKVCEEQFGNTNISEILE